jgi:ketopantoate reductase
MHVAIVGAGSLGRVYGVRLAIDAGVTVSFVVRPNRLHEGAMRIERIDRDQKVHVLAQPARAARIPGDADDAMVCVRCDQLDDSLIALLEEASAPLVVLTPMLPPDFARMKRALGERLVSAMPSVVAHTRSDGATRYWLPRAATTLIEEPRVARAKDAHEAALAELVGALDRAKITSRFAMGVHEQSPATTIAFMPLAMGIDAAGSVDALLDDDALLPLTLRAMAEARALAESVGKLATWASLLMTFIGPYTLKMGVALGRTRSPEALAYVEEHFGRKVHAQNVTMARQILALADEKRLSRDALAELAARLT